MIDRVTHMASAPAVAWTHARPVITPHDFLHGWTLDVWPILGVAAAGAVYAAGVRRLWARAGQGRGVARWRAVCFAGGLAALLGALVSPIGTLGESLFVGHMIQHLLLMAIAAPLLVLGAPVFAALWALPEGARRTLGRWWRGSFIGRVWALLSLPLVAWVLQTAVLWFWHLPRAYEAALTNSWVHELEHASFFLTACLFWWVVIPGAGRRRLSRGMDVLYVFTAGVQSSLLGALITLAGRPLYPAQSTAAAAWGLTPLEDQQVAGLIMWMPAGLVHLAAAGFLFVAWLRAEEASAGTLVRRAAI